MLTAGCRKAERDFLQSDRMRGNGFELKRGDSG